MFKHWSTISRSLESFWLSATWVINCKLTWIWHSWTLDARVERWTLDAGLWTLGSGRWVLEAGPWTLDSGCWTLYLWHCCRTESEPNLWFCLIKLLKILWVWIFMDHGHTCSVGSDVAIFRNCILTLSVKRMRK